MKVTARISKGFERAGHLKAYATICLADAFLVTGVRVVESENCLKVYMPSTKNPDGEYHDVCFPIVPACRTKIENAVLNAYDAYVKETEIAE